MFHHLEYNLKGSKRKIELKPVTAIVGAMGVGKTTALDAFRLACEGAYSRGNRKQDLAELGEDTYAIVRGSSGTGSWNPRSFTAPEPAPRLLPVDLFESLDVTPQSMRSVLFARYGSKAAASLGDPGALASQIRSLGLECGRIERELAASRSTFAVGGTERIDEIRVEFQQAEAYDRALTQKTQTEIADRERQARRESAVAELPSVEYELEKVRVEYERASTELIDLERRHRFGANLLELLRPARDSNTCPLCASGFDASARWNELQTKVGERERQVAECRELVRVLSAKRDARQTRKADLERWIGTTDQREIALPPKPVRDLAVIREELGRLEEARAYEKQQHVLRTQLESKRKEQAGAKVALEQLNSAITYELNRVKVEAEGAVNSLLFGEFKAELILTEKDCRWGIVSNGGTRSPRVASESQRTALALALAVSSGARYLLLDDRELAGVSARGMVELVSRLHGFAKDGLIEQAILTRHADRAHEVSDCFTISLDVGGLL